MAGRQRVSGIAGGSLSLGAVGSGFLGKMKPLFLKGLNVVWMWDGNILVEGRSRPAQACSHPVVRKMKGAGLQFGSITSGTTQLMRSLWAHADELICMCSLSENFCAKLPNCSVCRSKQDTPTSCACWDAPRRCRKRERAVPG